MNSNMQCIANGIAKVARNTNISVDNGLLSSDTTEKYETIQKMVNILMIPIFVLLIMS